MSKSSFQVKRLVYLSILAALGIPLMFISFAPIPATPWLKIDISDVVVYIAAVIFGPVSAIIVALIKSLAHFIIKGSEVGVPIDQLIAFTASLSFALPLYYVTKLVGSILKSNSKLVKATSVIISVLFLTVSISFTLAVWANFIFVTKLGYTVPNNFTYWVAILISPILLVLLLLLLSLITRVFHITEEMIIRVIPAMVGTLSLTVLLTFLNYIWFTPLYLDLLGVELPEKFLKYVLVNYGPFNLAKGLILSILYFVFSFRLNLLSNALSLKNEEGTLKIEE